MNSALTKSRTFLPDIPVHLSHLNTIQCTNSQSQNVLTRLQTVFSNDPHHTYPFNNSSRLSSSRRRALIQDIFPNGAVRSPSTPDCFSPIESPHVENAPRKPNRIKEFLLRNLSAIGVIYGDIGTSPIYTLTTVFEDQLERNEIPNHDDIVGVISNIVWLLILVVCIKYCIFVLSTSYHGEGGTFALYQKLVIHKEKMSRQSFMILIALTCSAAALLLGDATITPAVSIISALEGISEVQPSFTTDYVVVVAVVLVILLFAAQVKGSAKVGIIFGPTLIVWFITIAAFGINNLAQYGNSIVHALNPYSAIQWWTRGNYAGWSAFKSLSNLALSITGAETLFADMGHFGRDTVNFSWVFLVFPSLLLQYLGQGAYMLHVSHLHQTYPSEMMHYETSIFWSAIPKSSRVFYYVIVALATVSTVVASQAVISGAFTLMSQASALGFVPKLHVVHTNSKQQGQVYIGVVAVVECLTSIVLIVAYQRSTNLVAAYGAAVTSVFLITTIIIGFYIAPLCWKWNVFSSGILLLSFGILDFLLWLSSMRKIPTGAWLPLVLATIILIIMYVWTSTNSKVLQVAKENKRVRIDMTLEESPVLVIDNKNLPLHSHFASEESQPQFTTTEFLSPVAETQYSLAPSPAVKTNSPVVRNNSHPLEEQEPPLFNSPCDDCLMRSCSSMKENVERQVSISIPSSVTHSEGVGIFIAENRNDVPSSLERLVTRLNVVPKYLLLVSIEVQNEPFVSDCNRMKYHIHEHTDEGLICSVFISYGWAEPLSSLHILKFFAVAAMHECQQEIMPLPLLNRFKVLRLDPNETCASFEGFPGEYLSVYSTTKIVRPVNTRSYLGIIEIQIYNFLKSALSPTIVEFLRIPPENITEIGVTIFV